MATSIFRSLQRTGSNLLAKNNRWGSRLMTSKKAQKSTTLFNNNIKQIMCARSYAKDVKKEDSAAKIDKSNPFILSKDMKENYARLYDDDKETLEAVLTMEEEARLDELMQKTFSDAIKGLWAGEIARLPEDEVSPEKYAEIQKNLETRILEVAAKAPVQFMEFASAMIVDREKEKNISARIDDPTWWQWDNPFVRDSFMLSLRNNYKEFQKFLIKPGTGEIDGSRAPGVYEAAEQIGDQAFITPEDIVSSDAKENEFDRPQRARRECLLCSEVRHEFPLEPMNVPFLRRFMNTSGNILGRPQTGLCRKHQSKVQKTIKWAKHIGIFQYKEGFQVFNPARTTRPEAEEVEIPEWMLTQKQ